VTALNSSEKASVAVGYLSQFIGLPVVVPSVLWKWVDPESPARPHLARAIDLHMITWVLAFGLVIASSAFADKDPFRSALASLFGLSILWDIALLVVALRGIKPSWVWRPVLLRRWTSV